MSTAKLSKAHWIARISLLVVAILLCIAGVTGAFDTTKLSGNAILEPDGVTSIRVDFGGFHLGLGLFSLLGFLKTQYLRPALVAASITMTLVITMRVLGLAIDGATDAQFSTLSVEVIPFLLSLLGLALVSLTKFSS